MPGRPLLPRRAWLQGLAVVAAATCALHAEAGPSKGDSAKAPPSGRAWLGVELAKAEGGVLAKRVMRGSPAEKGGIKSADLILSVDGQAVSAGGEVVRIVADKGVGTAIKVKVRRGKDEVVVSVTLADYPGEEEVLRLDKVGTFAASWKGVKSAQGDVSDIKKLRGRVVLVEFWASWCMACRVSTPNMNDLHKRFGAQGLTVVGLTDDAEEAAAKAIQKLAIKYAIGAATSADTISEYGVRSLPTFFIVDKKGVIREVFVGAAPLENLENAITKLLKEPASS